jgi:hypothetical protein
MPHQARNGVLFPKWTSFFLSSWRMGPCDYPRFRLPAKSESGYQTLEIWGSHRVQLLNEQGYVPHRVENLTEIKRPTYVWISHRPKNTGGVLNTEFCNFLMMQQCMSLTPCSYVLLEKPPVAQLLKNYLTFYETRRFTTVFTRTFHWSLLWARWIQFIPPHPTSPF